MKREWVFHVRALLLSAAVVLIVNTAGVEGPLKWWIYVLTALAYGGFYGLRDGSQRP